MEKELLVFTARENFDFFKFDSSRLSGVLSDEAKDSLKEECQTVLEHAHKAVKDMCVWGYELAKLRDNGRWKFVVNPENGMRFLYSTFEKFCTYAFGFSATHTSNLLRVANFLYQKEGKLEFYNERYRDFNFSQLVELASVERFKWPLFTSALTVQQMRLCKKYLTLAGSPNTLGVTKENLLEKAQAWDASLDADESDDEADVQEQLDLPDVGKETDEVQDDQDDQNVEDSDGEVPELTEEQKEEYIKQSFLSKSFEFRIDILAKYRCNPTNNEFVSFIKERYGLSGFSLFDDPYSVRCSAKGYVLSGSGGTNFDVLLSWYQVAERIVSLINKGEYVTSEEIAEHFEKGAEPDVPAPIDVVGECESDDVEDVAEEDDEEPETEEETVRNAYDFSTREGVRTFLNNWERWMYYSMNNGMFFGSMCRYFVFKNRMRLFALQQRVCNNVDEDLTSDICVRYFIEVDQTDIDLGNSTTYILMSKSQLEKYIALHKDEL